MVEPLDPAAAKRLIMEILETGTWVSTDHARIEMGKDGMSDQDVINVLRGGVVGPAEWENGRWRHHVRTGRMERVVQLESETELRLITAWRLKR